MRRRLQSRLRLALAPAALIQIAGSGTVLHVAEQLQRNSIGIDANAVYLDIQARRTNGVQVELFV